MNPRRRAVIGATAVAGLAVVGLLAEMISHDATHPASSPPDKPYTPPSPFAMPTNSPAKQPLWQTSNGSSSDAKISALDGVLYVATNGGLKAVNATGATTWTTSSSEFGSAETNGLSAPVAVGKQLFSLDGAALIGISADHNNIASTVRLPPTAGQDPNPVTDIIGVVGSAIVCRVIGHSSATGGTDGLLSTVDTKTSAVLWSVPSTGVPEATTAQGDLLVVADTGIITAYHALTGKPVWQTPNQNEQGYQGADIPRGLLAAATTRLYQATAASIRSLDAATGRLGWTSAPPLAGGSYSSLIAEEGFVYGITLTPDELKQSVTTGTVFALREADGSVAWSVSDIPCDNTPSNFILSDGVLYTKDRNSTMLMALDAASGTTLWHWQEQYPLYEDLWGTGLAADSERVYATLQEGIAAFSIR
jgi:outer membrane protein assembly factor BamB